MKAIVIEKLAALITAAFGLVAALAWNGAIQALFVKYFGVASTIGPMLTYAVLVTIIAVVATIIIGKAEQKAKQAELLPKGIKINPMKLNPFKKKEESENTEEED